MRTYCTQSKRLRPPGRHSASNGFVWSDHHGHLVGLAPHIETDCYPGQPVELGLRGVGKVR